MARTDISPPQVCPGNEGGSHELSEHFDETWESGPLPGVNPNLNYFANYGICKHCAVVVCFKLESEPVE